MSFPDPLVLPDRPATRLDQSQELAYQTIYLYIRTFRSYRPASAKRQPVQPFRERTTAQPEQLHPQLRGRGPSPAAQWAAPRPTAGWGIDRERSLTDISFLPGAGGLPSDPNGMNITWPQVGMTAVVLASATYLQQRSGCDFPTAVGEAMAVPTAVVAIGKAKASSLRNTLTRIRRGMVRVLDPAPPVDDRHAQDGGTPDTRRGGKS